MKLILRLFVHCLREREPQYIHYLKTIIVICVAGDRIAIGQCLSVHVGQFFPLFFLFFFLLFLLVYSVCVRRTCPDKIMSINTLTCRPAGRQSPLPLLLVVVRDRADVYGNNLQLIFVQMK